MMSGGVEQYSPIIGDVTEPPSYTVNLSSLKQRYYCFDIGKKMKQLTNCTNSNITIQNE